MNRNTIIIVVLILASFVAGHGLAQDETPEPSPLTQACTEDEAKQINDLIDSYSDLVIEVINDKPEPFYQGFDSITRHQWSYWQQLSFLPQCADTFTRGYEFGRVIDDYSIAYGLATLANFLERSGVEGLPDRYRKRLDEQVHTANTLLQEKLPDIFEKISSGINE